MPHTLEPPINTERFAVIREIESQMIQLNIKIKDEVKISDYVKLLSEKRQLQELLNQYNNEK